MSIAIDADEYGLELKQVLCRLLAERGAPFEDLAYLTSHQADYPDVALNLARQVQEGRFDRGILICGTGIGMAIAANKFPGVRAAPCFDELTAELSRRHNNLNVLCLSADMLGDRLVGRLIDVWLKTEFEGGRNARRVEKIEQLEKTESDCKS